MIGDNSSFIDRIKERSSAGTRAARDPGDDLSGFVAAGGVKKRSVFDAAGSPIDAMARS
jgi:hypothetical protein